jgi:3-phenylpropionate/trans-cinnamate dioxygenase ferredoxin subunit
MQCGSRRSAPSPRSALWQWSVLRLHGVAATRSPRCFARFVCADAGRDGPAMTPRSLGFPPSLRAPGVADDTGWTTALPVAELPPGAMRRISRGDLDVLIAHTTDGIVAVDDRCPHMSAPLSIGELDGCVVACPLHEGRFDLASGEPVRMPTTGGLDPDGRYHPVWTPAGKAIKDDVPGRKAEARRLTRVRRLRYYPVRIEGDRIEVALPEA